MGADFFYVCAAMHMPEKCGAVLGRGCKEVIMIQVKRLTVTHKKDLRTIVKEFSFVLNDGDKAVIIGEEGNGKSTILKLIYDDALADYVTYEGEIIKNGAKMGYLPQELREEVKDKTVYEYFAESEYFFLLSPKEQTEIARQLGMKSEQFYSDQLMRTLSGGEKVKMQIAYLLMQSPDVFLMDEPSNDLDIGTLQWLEQFIRELKKPVLFISHDETLIEHTANVVIHLEQIRKKTVPVYTVAKLPYRQYMEERGRKFEHQGQVARKERSDYERQQERYQQIYNKVEHQQNAVSRQDPHTSQLLKKKMHAVKSMGKRFEREKENMTEIPEQETAIGVKFDESIRVPNGKTVLDIEVDELKVNEKAAGKAEQQTDWHETGVRALAKNISLHVTGSEKVVIIGRNGVGKSTFLKKIAEELQVRTDIKASYMPQNYEELLELQKTPVEFLERTGEKDELTKIRTYLGSMKYTRDEMEHHISELSGGQKAKLLLMKMNLDGSNVLILDEPTRNFSPLSGPVIRKSLREFGGAVISISHDRKYISEVCDTVYELKPDGLHRVYIEKTDL